MNSFKKPLLKVTGLLALAFLLAFGCADTPEDPDLNLKSDTFITSYSINIVPDSPADTTWWQDGVPHDTLTTAPDSVIYRTSLYMATVYWRGSDTDGEPAGYRYWVDNGDPVEISDTEVSILLSFPNTTTTYTFYVQSKDNSNEWDETPALKVLDLTQIRDVTDPTFLPNTEGLTVPPNGASTSQGVPFAISGSDVDGIVTAFEWAIDDPTAWTTITPDVITVGSSIGEITLLPGDLSLGAHMVYFRSLDNMGNYDPSPLTISIICEAGYAPEVTVSVSDGQSFMVPFTAPTIPDFTINFGATVDFYYGLIDSFVVNSSEGLNVNTSDTEVNLGTLNSGSHWVEVIAYDAGGNSTTTGQVNFSIDELAAGDGVLCVNGVDWGTYGGQIVSLWSNGTPWGNRTSYKCWDLFDTTPLGSVPLMADSLLGYGSIPAWMFDTTFFDAITWIGNNYSGDLDYWDERETEMMAYLAMGGNIILPTRLGHYFFFDDLATYTGIVADSWESPGADILTAKDVRLTDITSVSNQSLWEVPMTNNPDNTWIYEAATEAAGGHAGFCTLPNGDGGGGGFCYIAGRSYRWNQTDLKANIDVILNTFFGIN